MPASPAPTPLALTLSRSLAHDDWAGVQAAYGDHPIPLSGPFEPNEPDQPPRTSLLTWAIQAQAVRVVHGLMDAGVSWHASAHDGLDPVALALRYGARALEGERWAGASAHGLSVDKARHLVDCALDAAQPLGLRFLDEAQTQPVLVFALDGLLRSGRAEETSWAFAVRLLEAGADAKAPEGDKAPFWAFLTAVASRRLRDVASQGPIYEDALQALLHHGASPLVRSSDFGFAQGTLLHAMVGLLHYQYDTRPKHAENAIEAFNRIIPVLLDHGLPLHAKARALRGPRGEAPPGRWWQRRTALQWAEQLGGHCQGIVPALRRYQEADALTRAVEEALQTRHQPIVEPTAEPVAPAPRRQRL